MPRERGDAAGDHRLAEGSASRNAHSAIIVIGALALFGDEKIVGGRIIDDASDELAFAFERQRHSENR